MAFLTWGRAAPRLWSPATACSINGRSTPRLAASARFNPSAATTGATQGGRDESAHAPAVPSRVADLARRPRVRRGRRTDRDRSVGTGSGRALHRTFPRHATPAIAGGSIYVSYHDELVAYDLHNLSVRWRVPQEPALFHFSGNIESKWGRNELPRRRVSAPLATNTRVLLCDTGGNIRCFDSQNSRETSAFQSGIRSPAHDPVGKHAFRLRLFGGIHALAW